MAAKKKAAQQEAEELETSFYRVQQNLRHDGKHYHPKSLVELTEKDAQDLIALKVIDPRPLTTEDALKELGEASAN